MFADPYCLPCERYNCWIEIDVRDEHNRSFKGQQAILTDQTGQTYTVTLQDGPTLVEGFAVGPVTVKIATDPWLKAAQRRAALKDNEVSTVADYTAAQLGHCAKVREHIKVTSGDLCLTDPEQPLPKGHQAGQAQPPRFITQHSYVIEVKGYQLTTLRIGVFFDGTSNSTFKHQEGKPQLEAFLASCSAAEREAWVDACRDGDLPLGNDSEKNDVTNIGKAHALYRLPNKTWLTVPVYIEGIGASKGKNDAVQATGGDAGSTGSGGRVEQACRTRIVEELKRLLEDILPTLECISRIEFDVFGFSRGASAARQFIKHIDQKADHPLVAAFANEPTLRLKAGFDWASRDDVRIMFGGLFDTVVSSYLGGKRDVMLTADCAERVVHLIAADDWRAHFDLTRIKDLASDLPPHFTEVIMPGAHSDIGGGYYSRWSVRSPNYADPLLMERKVIANFDSVEPMGRPASQSKAYQEAREYARVRVQQGWAKGVTELDSPPLRLTPGYLYLIPKTVRAQGQLTVLVEVLLYRVVEGEYSRIALHIMVEAARDAGVPFGNWLVSNQHLRLDSGAFERPRVDLTQLDQGWVNAGKAKGRVVDLTHNLNEAVYRELRLRYLHYSAYPALAFSSNKVGPSDRPLAEREQRQINANDRGGF